MAVSRVKTSSILQGFPKSRSLLAGNTYYDPAATFLIQRTTLTSTQTSITFSSIPSTYKSLQIRANVLCAANLTFRIKLNGDTTAANYSRHHLSGNGATVAAGGAANSTAFIPLLVVTGTVATYPNVFITDIHDYASITKNKTVRSISGSDKNAASGSIELDSGAWFSTAAVTSVTIDIDGTSTFSSGTTFALYGMVG
jgi:hypothetical protein